MRDQISVKLDDITSLALEKIISVNKCTISDAVNVAILAYGQELKPTMHLPEDPVADFIAYLPNDMTLKDWCQKRQIKIKTLRYLLRRTAKGGAVWGTGNTKNKWRDRNDDRLFKTHTAWIAHWLYKDFGLDIT